MKIDIRLKRVLQTAGLDSRGVTQRIAEDLGLHRHTIGKLYRNQLRNPSLDVLGKLCDWLKSHGVNEELPQALFGVRPTELWKALTEVKRLTFYVGEYEEEVNVGPSRRWVAPRDFEAWAHIVHTMTCQADLRPNLPELKPAYVLSRWTETKTSRAKELWEEDKESAGHFFKDLFEESSASILIGSQRANFLLEYVLAELFRAESFHPARDEKEQRAPVYLLYPERGRVIESCFGGSGEVPGWPGRTDSGTYWRNEQGQWEFFPWRQHQQDAGVIITVYYPGTAVVHVAVFGFSGRGTALVAKKLCEEATLFWPPYATAGGRHVGLYICKFTARQPPPPSRDALAELDKNECEVVRMSEKTIKQHLE